MTDRKKPGVAFWMTVVVLLVAIAYPLSFGPVCLIWGRQNCDFPGLFAIYEPCIRAVESGPAPVQWALWQWADCWRAAGKLDEIVRSRKPATTKELDIAEYRRAIEESDEEHRRAVKQSEEALRKIMEGPMPPEEKEEEVLRKIMEVRTSPLAGRNLRQSARGFTVNNQIDVRLAGDLRGARLCSSVDLSSGPLRYAHPTPPE